MDAGKAALRQGNASLRQPGRERSSPRPWTRSASIRPARSRPISGRRPGDSRTASSAGAPRLVYAVDVDTKQLDWKLRGDPRVVLIEKNARSLAPADFPRAPKIVTMDVSFISVLKILPALKSILAPGGALVVLIKPQFEAPASKVGKGGSSGIPPSGPKCSTGSSRGGGASGFVLGGLVRCSTRGRTGNVEFLARFSRQRRRTGARSPGRAHQGGRRR